MSWLDSSSVVSGGPLCVCVYACACVCVLSDNTWLGTACERLKAHFNVMWWHISLVCPKTQSEKSWSCDLSCCRVDSAGGLDAEGCALRTGPLLWSAAFARSSRNLSNSERDRWEEQSERKGGHQEVWNTIFTEKWQQREKDIPSLDTPSLTEDCSSYISKCNDKQYLIK